jgi:O-methyltransferase involved in polyketide biosynthesis
VELDAHLLRRAAGATALALPRLVLGALHPAPFNAHIAETGSKSLTHFHWLMQGLLPLLREGAQEVVLDRTGALTDHASHLARAFPGVGVTRTLKERSEQRYLLRRGERRIRLTFREKGEDSAFAVALAACLAKYVREVFMECQNRWFTRRQPGLRPTLGYFRDGRRFLGEARAVIRSEALAEQVLIRCR